MPHATYSKKENAKQEQSKEEQQNRGGKPHNSGRKSKASQASTDSGIINAFFAPRAKPERVVVEKVNREDEKDVEIDKVTRQQAKLAQLQEEAAVERKQKNKEDYARAIAKLQEISNEANSVYQCFPCTPEDNQDSDDDDKDNDSMPDDFNFDVDDNTMPVDDKVRKIRAKLSRYKPPKDSPLALHLSNQK
jgi:hypothetical protein